MKHANLALVLALTVFACAHGMAVPASPEPGTSAPAALFSEPVEYRERPVSAEAGAVYFGETGLGDPYAAGIPYPVLLAMMRAYPSALGEDWLAFSAKFGALPRDPSARDRTALPVGFHLATDPATHVAFVMNNCELCHAERLHLPQGDVLVPGLGNKRVQIHAYDAALTRIAGDPGFTSERLARFANEAAAEQGLRWPSEWRAPLLEATVNNLKKRAAVRGAEVDRLAAGLPGRVATIESFLMALGLAEGHPLPMPEQPGWAKIPDVRSTRYRDTLSWDGVGTGAPTALVVEADLAFGARPEWFETHRHLGTSLYLYLRGFERTLPFPGQIDAGLAQRGHELFVKRCSRCHGRYEEGGAVYYREQVVSLTEVGTDPARSNASTPAFIEAANAVPAARGVRRVAKTDGYVPPPLLDVWARAPFGHAGQWPTLRAMATSPRARPRRFVIQADAAYDLDAVGVATRPAGGGPLATGEYVYDADGPGLGVLGHPFLADLGPDAAAVIEYLKGL